MREIERYRVSKWGNIETGERLYGVQARVGGKWLHCSRGSEAVILPTKPQADAEVARLNATLGTATRQALLTARPDDGGAGK